MFFLLIGISILQFVGVLVYVRNTLLGHSQPNRVTFFLWALIPAIALFAGFAKGESWALLPVFMAGFGPLLIFFSSFFNPQAYWKLRLLDYICGVLSVLAVILWIISGSPFIAVVFAILSDGLASIPTLVKSWRFPETEKRKL